MYDVSGQRNEWCAYYYCLFQVEALDLFDINLQWHIGHDWNFKRIIEELEKKAAISDKNKKEQQGAATQGTAAWTCKGSNRRFSFQAVYCTLMLNNTNE